MPVQMYKTKRTRAGSRTRRQTARQTAWSVAQARRHLAEVVRAAAREPQRIYRRDELVATVVDPKTFEEFSAWCAAQRGRTIGQAFAELRTICAAEGYTLEAPGRHDRATPFDDDELPL